MKIYYEPEMELLTVFWQPPRKDQVATELGDGVLLIKDGTTNEPIGMEILSYRPNDSRFDSVSVEMGRMTGTGSAEWDDRSLCWQGIQGSTAQSIWQDFWYEIARRLDFSLKCFQLT